MISGKSEPIVTKVKSERFTKWKAASAKPRCAKRSILRLFAGKLFNGFRTSAILQILDLKQLNQSPFWNLHIFLHNIHEKLLLLQPIHSV